MPRIVARARLLGLAILTAALVVPLLAGPAQADVSIKPDRTWSTNGRVAAILPLDGLVFVGGTFTEVVDTSGHTTKVSNIAVFNPADGTFSKLWTGGTNGTVTTLAASNTTLYVGGTFSTADGVARKRVAAMTLTTGSLIPTWHPSLDGTVDHMAVIGNEVYVGGVFLDVTDATGTYAQPYLARFDPITGLDDRSWLPLPDARVRAIVGSTDGSRIYLGGDFRTINGVGSANSVASIVTSTGALDPVFRSGPNNLRGHAQVLDMVTDGTHLIEAVGGGGGACTSQDMVKGTTQWSIHSNGNVQAVEIFGSDVYCGGHFDSDGAFGDLYRKKLAEVDLLTGAIQDFDPVVNSALGVWALGSDSTHLFVGGDFTKISTVVQEHFAVFTDLGSLTVPLAPLGLTAAGGNHAAFLAWSPPSSDGGSPVTSYTIYRAVGAGTLAKLATTAKTAYTDSTAVDGTTYTYAVAATNAMGAGPMSGTASATAINVTPTVPGAPTGLTATPAPASVQLSWTTPASTGNTPITAYQILRGTKAGAETLLTTIGATTSYTDAAVTLGTKYFYQVKAVNSVGAGASSSEASSPPAAGVPAAPKLTATAGSGQITLTWTVPSNGGSPITKYSLVRDGIFLANPAANATSYVDVVPKGQLHTYQIKAINAVGTSPNSNTVSATAK